LPLQRHAVEVHVAGVADPVAVDVVLRGIGDQRAVVDVVEHAVAVVVLVAGVALVVAVGVGLIGVGILRAEVEIVRDAVAVVVALAGVALAVAVAVGLLAVGEAGAVVDLVEGAVAVVVGIAEVAKAIQVEIGLASVGEQRTRVEVIRHTVVVGVRLTGVADVVVIAISLVGIGDDGTVVHGIEHTVAVVILVAHISLAVPIEVRLVGIRRGRAVVPWLLYGPIRDAVTITVRLKIGEAAPQQTDLTERAAAVGATLRLNTRPRLDLAQLPRSAIAIAGTRAAVTLARRALHAGAVLAAQPHRAVAVEAAPGCRARRRVLIAAAPCRQQRSRRNTQAPTANDRYPTPHIPASMRTRRSDGAVVAPIHRGSTAWQRPGCCTPLQHLPRQVFFRSRPSGSTRVNAVQ